MWTLGLSSFPTMNKGRSSLLAYLWSHDTCVAYSNIGGSGGMDAPRRNGYEGDGRVKSEMRREGNERWKNGL